MLRTHNLSVTLSGKSILNGISFQASENEIIGVIGKNGAGKTTLFNAIYQKIGYNGKITLNSKNILKADISYIETENYFYPFLTGEEYLSFFVTTKNRNWQKLLCDIFDIPMNRYIENLSTGERKKLAIVTHLLLNKKIYLFDEPFNGLDIESVELLKLLLQSKIFSSKIILISSHILSSITDICHKIILVEKGKRQNILSRTDVTKWENLLQSRIKLKMREIEKVYLTSI